MYLGAKQHRLFPVSDGDRSEDVSTGDLCIICESAAAIGSAGLPRVNSARYDLYYNDHVSVSFSFSPSLSFFFLADGFECRVPAIIVRRNALSLCRSGMQCELSPF